jgi:ribosomal protein S18 acetylase RimI-like enzyme
MREELLFIAEVEDAVVGFVVCGEADHALHLYLLAVHPNYGRRGIGRDLVVRVIEESARRRLTGVSLTTFEDLKWNAPFYQKLGFRILAPHETSANLASILSNERAAGMHQRVAMWYRNAA